MAAGQLLASGALDHVAPAAGGIYHIYKAFSRLGDFVVVVVVDINLADLMQSLRLRSRVEMPVHGFACLNWRCQQSSTWNWGKAAGCRSLGCSRLQGRKLGTSHTRRLFYCRSYTMLQDMLYMVSASSQQPPFCHLQKLLTGSLFLGLLRKSQPWATSVYTEKQLLK